jgi:hypothetical protein
MKDSFKKEGQDKEITGLTVMIDGVIQQVFDKIKNDREYDSYDEVLRDIIFEGINTIVKRG